jgi:hypothetical protein
VPKAAQDRFAVDHDPGIGGKHHIWQSFDRRHAFKGGSAILFQDGY